MNRLIPPILIVFLLNLTSFAQSSEHIQFLQLSQAPEICDNGLDDDGDGLIDCYDDLDCSCNNAQGCQVDTVPPNFQMQVEWVANPFDDVYSSTTPIVGNLNPGEDTLAEIIVFSYTGSQTTRNVLFYKGDGSDSNNAPRMAIAAGVSEPAIADLDGDGNPELFFVGFDQRIRIYRNFNPASNPPMQLWVTSNDLAASAYHRAYAADFDGDGLSELYAGNEVYALDLSNPAAPQLNKIVQGTGPLGRINSMMISSLATDLLTPADCNGDPDCAGLEIAAGYAIYSIDLDPNDGDGVQIKVQRNINTMSGQVFSDGFTAVADLDLNGTPEVVVASSRNGQFGMLAWNKTGFWRFLPSTNPTPGDHPGVLSISNVYDDSTLDDAVTLHKVSIKNLGQDIAYCALLPSGDRVVNG